MHIKLTLLTFLPYTLSMRYVLDTKTFFREMRSQGIRSVQEFSHTSGLHRNTLNLYLQGKGVFASAFEKIANALELNPTKLIIPISDTSFDIPLIDEIRPIIAHITHHDESLALLLIGSRAEKPKHCFSDWDLGVTRRDPPIGSKEFLQLKSDVEELADDLVRGVGLVNLDQAPLWFLKEMTEEPLLLGGDRESYIHFQGVLHGARKQHAA